MIGGCEGLDVDRKDGPLAVRGADGTHASQGCFSGQRDQREESQQPHLAPEHRKLGNAQLGHGSPLTTNLQQPVGE